MAGGIHDDYGQTVPRIRQNSRSVSGLLFRYFELRGGSTNRVMPREVKQHYIFQDLDLTDYESEKFVQNFAVAPLLLLSSVFLCGNSQRKHLSLKNGKKESASPH